jgi:alpha-N-arabinofuranosidase
VGEWATREGTPTPDFHAALADSAWMTGMERNSDIIVMASYAPLLTNINPGGMEWDTDLIGYNAMSSYGSPSYYAQVMFSGHHGNQILSSSLSGTPVRIYQSVTRDSATGAIYLKVVNATTEPADVAVKLTGGPKISPNGQMETLTAPSTEDTNTISDPKNIVPAAHAMPGLGDSFTLHLKPLSINVLTLHEQN